jgi:tRNA A-37 threonylcarbamoyl transferase component Bud32/tetratricopeptide (TPR) repeat protein
LPDSDAERYAAAKAIFTAALELPADERIAFIGSTCADDDALRVDVESLLVAYIFSDERDFLGQSARERLRTDHAHHLGLVAGERLGAYRVIRELARGGMGTVYLAERADAEFEQRVAIKLVTRGMDTELVLRRFRRERQILAELQHPNIARLLEGGTTSDGLPYFVMEYIDGQPIDAYCESHRLSFDARLDLFRDVCAAVQYAHQRLVVHRDIKPGNILVTTDGVPKLLDFGIAKLLIPSGDTPDLTAPLFAAMTPEFASPEQLAGGTVTTLSDVYSLGVVLYQVLTGTHPSPAQRSDASEQAPPSRVVPSLRGDIDTLVLAAMRRDPERRYASAQAFSDDILRYRRGLPLAARVDSWTYRARKFARRNRLAVGIASLSIAALGVGAVALAWQAHVADQHRVIAERRFADVRRLALSLLFDVHDSIAVLPGSTRARQMIVTRSLEALDSLALDDANDPALRKDMAAAYLRVGDVLGQPYHENLGETDAALASYGRAAALLEPILAANDADTDARRDLAAAFMKIGGIRMRAREWDAAVQNERRAIALVEGSIVRAPHDAKLQRSLSDALVYLGDAIGAGDDRHSLAQIAAARDVYTRALNLRMDLLHRAPHTAPLLRAVSSAYARIAYVAFWTAEVTADTTQFAMSLANHHAAQELRHELVLLDPSSPSRRLLADGWMDMAQSELPLGHLKRALALYDSAGPLFIALARDDAANAEARRDLAYFHENRGVVFVALKQWANAERDERVAITTLSHLSENDPGSLEEYYHLAHAQEVLGDALALHASRAEVIAAYDDALSTLHRWQRAEPTAAQPGRLEKEIAQRIARIR